MVSVCVSNKTDNSKISRSERIPVADPGFPRGGGANPGGALTYDFAKFSQKLHAIERIWTGGRRVSLAPPLDLSLNFTCLLEWVVIVK